MTRLEKEIIREVAITLDFRNKARKIDQWAVSLRPSATGALISFRQKRTRKSYSYPLSSVLSLALQADWEAQRKAKKANAKKG